ncbi:transposase [Streptacidiphilus sp. MAP12-20]|uniref:ISL3 family transposase n=1 Tax=Streptacidiphilus sp. MAP12-20 TaxID=3156299 RepID=UPI0035184355
MTTFSHLASVVIEEVTVSGGAVELVARTTTREAACPGCGTVSGRVHGGYRRRLADLAVAGRQVVIYLAVQRFVCPEPECGRRTFVEQVDGLTEPFARRTSSLRCALEKIALALAGRPAARLAAHLSVPASPNSLLRLVRRLPDKQATAAPRVLGVDDFAFKKGHVYGTILLDTETGERVDVLRDRTAGTLSTWLREHPGAEILCRDRANA